jgi:hypothetical protein
MFSWDALDPLPFKSAGPVAAAFRDLVRSDLRSAARHVCGLPYGRNSDPSAPLIVLLEKRGTCSTKHALLRRLAMEQGFGLALILGLYEMTERNTPGIGPVLQSYGISSLLEAHCYLRTTNGRIDITRLLSAESRAEPIDNFLHEEEITPDQITHYKTAVHKTFLQRWIVGQLSLNEFSLDEIWRIREECIARLSQLGSAGF